MSNYTAKQSVLDSVKALFKNEDGLLKKRFKGVVIAIIVLILGCSGVSTQPTFETSENKNRSKPDTYAPTKKPHSKDQYDLAIFPCKLIDAGAANTSMTYQHSIGTIYPIIRKYDKINVEYSFHAFSPGQNTDVSFNLPIDNDQIEKIWKRKSIFSKNEPDIELIIEYGKKMDIDLALTLYAYGTNNDPQIDLYLIDVNSGEVFHANQVLTWHGLYYDALEQETTKVIEQFLRTH